MTKDELIVKQQLEIEGYKQICVNNEKIKRQMIGRFFNIGAPLNDNNLKMNENQLKWCLSVSGLIDEIETQP